MYSASSFLTVATFAPLVFFSDIHPPRFLQLNCSGVVYKPESVRHSGYVNWNLPGESHRQSLSFQGGSASPHRPVALAQPGNPRPEAERRRGASSSRLSGKRLPAFETSPDVNSG